MAVHCIHRLYRLEVEVFVGHYFTWQRDTDKCLGCYNGPYSFKVKDIWVFRCVRVRIKSGGKDNYRSTIGRGIFLDEKYG